MDNITIKYFHLLLSLKRKKFGNNMDKVKTNCLEYLCDTFRCDKLCNYSRKWLLQILSRIKYALLLCQADN